MRKIMATAIIAAFGIAGVAPAVAADAATVTLSGGTKAVMNVLRVFSSFRFQIVRVY